jgi:hypothetical protein
MDPQGSPIYHRWDMANVTILVCLSLLNTWEGNPNEMWQPNKSTVLSVLVSIQAMILGAPVPWINEPGFSNQESTPQAKEHKLLMQAKTVKYAMIGWLENKFSNSDSKEYVWKDISQMYWKNNGKAAFETVKVWAVDNPDLEKFGPKPTPRPTRFRRRISSRSLLTVWACLAKLRHTNAKPARLAHQMTRRSRSPNLQTRTVSSFGGTIRVPKQRRKFALPARSSVLALLPPLMLALPNWKHTSIPKEKQARRWSRNGVRCERSSVWSTLIEGFHIWRWYNTGGMAFVAQTASGLRTV